MRANSQVMIYIDVPKAMAAGLKFQLSSNGVVLTEGDDKGFISPELFERVEFNAKTAADSEGTKIGRDRKANNPKTTRTPADGS